MIRRIFIVVMLTTGLANAGGTVENSDIRPISAEEFAEILEAARGKVVLVNLWATWCAPCLREIPELLELREKYHDRDFRLIAVAMDDLADLQTHVVPFRDRHFPEWQSWQSAEPEMDRFVSVIDRAWNDVLPTSYLIDREGTLAKVLFGGKSFEAFETALLEVL